MIDAYGERKLVCKCKCHVTVGLSTINKIDSESKIKEITQQRQSCFITVFKSQSQHVSSGECHSQPNVPTVISWPAAVSLLFYCTFCPCLLTWTVTVKQIHGKISQKILSRPKQKKWETSALSKTVDSRDDFIAGNNLPQAPWHHTSGS